MSPAAFVLLLAVAAALLALWTIARFSSLGPHTLFWAGVNVVAAFVLLRLTPLIIDTIGASGVPALRWIEAFGIALPLLYYAFLSGGWLTRVALGLLRR